MSLHLAYEDAKFYNWSKTSRAWRACSKSRFRQTEVWLERVVPVERRRRGPAARISSGRTPIRQRRGFHDG